MSRSSAASGRTGLLALAAAALLLSWRDIATLPTPPSQTSATEFSAERAMNHVRAIARAPRPTGSEELGRVRRYIVSQLHRLHLPLDTTTATAAGSRYAAAGTVTNILARLPGRGPPGKAVLLVAHYDGVRAGPAAGDDGSGVAIILETLRALKAGPPLVHDVLALFTDGEESGLLGAADFAARKPRVGEVGVVVNLEARGSSGRSLLFETSPGDLALVRAVAGVVPDATGTSFLAGVYHLLPNDTDFSELRLAGLPGLNFAFIGDARTYHTPSDDFDHLDPASVAHQGRAALALAHHFGEVGPPAAGGPDATFFTLPLVGMIVYPATWARPLVALAVAAALSTIVAGVVRRRFRLRDPAIGFAGFLVTAAAAVGLSLLAWLGVSRVHAGWQRGGAPSWSGVYLGALLFLMATAVFAAAAAVRHWVRAPGIIAGTLPAWIAAAVVTAAVLPGGSFVFTWPALLAAVALGISIAAPGRRLARWLAGSCAALAGSVAVALITHIVVMVFQGLALGPLTVAVIGVVVVLVLWPLAEWLPEPVTRRWWALPAASGAAAGFLFALGLRTVRTDDRHPRRDLVVYSLDAAAHAARWYASGNRPDAYSRQFVGGAPERLRPSPLERLGITALVETPDLLGAPAPAVDLPAPRVRVVGDSVADGRRTLLLRVTSERAGSELVLRATGGAVRSASVNGRPIVTRWRRRKSAGWRLTYTNPGREGILLRLELSAANPIHLEVADRSDGLPAVPGSRFEPRPLGLEPIQLPDATLVFRSYDL